MKKNLFASGIFLAFASCCLMAPAHAQYSLYEYDGGFSPSFNNYINAGYGTSHVSAGGISGPDDVSGDVSFIIQPVDDVPGWDVNGYVKTTYEWTGVGTPAATDEVYSYQGGGVGPTYGGSGFDIWQWQIGYEGVGYNTTDDFAEPSYYNQVFGEAWADKNGAQNAGGVQVVDVYHNPGGAFLGYTLYTLVGGSGDFKLDSNHTSGPGDISFGGIGSTGHSYN